MNQTETQPTKSDRLFAASQWLADATTWSRRFPNEAWRKLPVRGLLGSLGSDYKNCDCEGVAGAVLALCESGDERYPSFARPECAAVLASAISEIATIRPVEEAKLGEDTTHARLVCLVGLLCTELEPGIFVCLKSSTESASALCAQILVCAWYLDAISGQ